MAVLVYSAIENEMLDALVANVTTNAPTSAAERLRAINSAYQMVWEISGGRLKKIASAGAWTAAQLASGIVYGNLTDIEEIKTLWYTATAPAVIVCATSTSVNVTSAALFGSVVTGMAVSGSGVPANTFVESVTTTSALILTQATTSTVDPVNLTFSPTAGTTVQPAEWAEIQWLRSASGLPTYSTPKRFAAVRPATVTEANKNKLELHYWPSVTGFYFPMAYVSQFTPMDGDAGDVPEVNDLESYDIAWIAALDLAPRLDRQELAPGIALKVSEGTRAALDRKQAAGLHGKQDAELDAEARA